MRIRITDKNPVPWKPEELAQRLVYIIDGDYKAFKSPQGGLPVDFDPNDMKQPVARYQLGPSNNYWLHVKGDGVYDLTFRYSEFMSTVSHSLAFVITRFCFVTAEVTP